jgi:hypothetical protein
MAVLTAVGVVLQLGLVGQSSAKGPSPDAIQASASPRPTIDLAIPAAGGAISYVANPATGRIIMAPTAVDHRFAGETGLVGSAGFLCGRHPGTDNNGAATALGYDPNGRFLGAKLSFAFR